MNLTISWSNYNAGAEDGVNVYRDIAPITDALLPTPIVTLPPGSTSYVDTTVTRGIKYYYRIGIYKGSDQLLTKNKAIRAVAPADTGPGPQSLAAGDWDLGLFGIVRSSNFITYGNLAANVGYSTGTVLPEKDWIKISYNGKVLFIARNVAREDVSYNSLYLAGIVFGTNDNGLLVPSGQVATNQFKPQTIAGFTLIPRILQGLPKSSTAYPTTDNNNTMLNSDPGSNEWDDIMGAIVGGSPRWVGDTTYGKLTQVRDEFGAIDIGRSIAVVDICQQLPNLPNTATVWRGGRGSYIAPWTPGSFGTVTATSTRLTTSINWSSSAYLCWRPVLELVL